MMIPGAYVWSRNSNELWQCYSVAMDESKNLYVPVGKEKPLMSNSDLSNPNFIPIPITDEILNENYEAVFKHNEEGVSKLWYVHNQYVIIKAKNGKYALIKESQFRMIENYRGFYKYIHDLQYLLKFLDLPDIKISQLKSIDL